MLSSCGTIIVVVVALVVLQRSSAQGQMKNYNMLKHC